MPMGGKGSGSKELGERARKARQVSSMTNDMSLDMWMDIYNAPCIDLGDADAIRQRLQDYVDLCKKYNCRPGVGAWCQYIGCTRDEIINWSKGKRTRLDRLLTPASAVALQRTFGLFEVTWETTFLQNGFSNPVTGIFYAKNNFGYKDESQTVVKHADSERGPDIKALQEKYAAAIPESIEVDATVEKVDEGAKQIEPPPKE